MVGAGSALAVAPAKLILLGEHAVNRGQPSLAVSVGLYASCTAAGGAEPGIHLVSSGRRATVSRAALRAFAREMERHIAGGDVDAVRRLVADDWWAPAKYVLADFGSALPARLTLSWESRIPASGGLGSGAACFVALVAALDRLLGGQHTQAELAALARRGDILAHGGIASGLDTSASLYGGAIRFTVDDEATPVAAAPGLVVVIGDTGVHAPTAVVNRRVREWLAEQPSRRHYFDAIGTLCRLAEPALATGDWELLGRLIDLNQLVLERIGVSSPELERLNAAALEAGALGAKLSGSGGGGVMFALVLRERCEAVVEAIGAAGGRAIAVPVAVPGVQVIEQTAVRRAHSS